MRRHRKMRIIRWIFPLPVLVAAATGLTAGSVAAAPPYTLEERAVAIASPSLVFLDVRLEGYLRIKGSGALVESSAVDVHSLCSGFVVSGDGHVITTTHCLQPTADSLRGSAVYIVANDLIKANRLAASQKASFIAQRMRDSVFTGVSADLPPVSTLTGQLFVGSSDPATATSFTGRVVDSQPVNGGDITLIKLDTSGLPVAQLTTTTLTPELGVVSIGFGAAADGTYTPVSRASTVLGRYGGGAPLRYRLDGDIGTTSNGGMVVDNSGQVLGVITADVSSTDRSNKLVAGTTQILSLLTSAGVPNTLTPLDTTYRAGLDAYFGGRYRDAITSLDAVLAAQPDNIPARTYRQHASERLAVEGDQSTSPAIWKIVAIAAGGGVLVVLIPVSLFALRRARRRATARAPQQPAQPPPAAPAVHAGVPVTGVPAAPVPLPTNGFEPVWQGWSPPPAPPARPVDTPPEDQSAAWPDVTVWRDMDSSPPIPPPAPAPHPRSASAPPQPVVPSPNPTPTPTPPPGPPAASPYEEQR